MRLDKYLAHAGLGSRKDVKLWIRKGQVCVNGVVCKKDDAHMQEQDVITLEGEVISYQREVYIMLYKPQGVVSATVDAMHPTVFDCMDVILPTDCFPVGRLDIDTEGLLIITNDGVFAHNLLAPKKHVNKTYYVAIEHSLTSQDIQRLEEGSIVLEEDVLKPAHVEVIDEKAIHLTIQEGKYHQVKRMLEAVGNRVTYLKRITMGSLSLDSTLQPGEWRYLNAKEIEELKQSNKKG